MSSGLDALIYLPNPDGVEFSALQRVDGQIEDFMITFSYLSNQIVFKSIFGIFK